ncbi:hypothetical protein SETIT_4G236800v2 [Setaria italica]|uniref:Dirigent protein n=1 Tax=Setaria italica TaxID=4555 RepID=A0A368QZD3_SETIT|nr:hypothetical protein SETIT_4G236800v2 [Setaria italica]
MKLLLLSPTIINPGYIPATSISQTHHNGQLCKAAASARLLLLVAVIVLLLPSADARRRPVHLRLYMHDIIGGPEQTAIHLIRNAGPPHKSLKGAYFGDTMAIDDLVTDGPGIDSGSVGRAQGTYMLSSQHEEVLVAAVTRQHLLVAGRVGIYDKSELPIVGGTGQLRRAAGYVLWRMAKVVSEVYIVVELIVHMSVPANAAAPSNGSSLAIE